MLKDLERLIEELVDHDVEVEIDDDFKYDVDGGGTVYYAINEDFNTECNLDWKEFLAERYNFDLTEENWFVMSILHELGHHYTIEYFSDYEWNKMCTVLKSDDRREVNFDHFNKLNERVATEWAINFYNMNPKEMKYFCSRINAELKKIKCANT